MYQLVVSYAHPSDPEAFLAHYRETHVALARGLPGISSYDWTICESADGSRPPHFVIAVIRWESREHALAALGSDAGQAAVADLAHFAAAGVDFDLGAVQPV